MSRSLRLGKLNVVLIVMAAALVGSMALIALNAESAAASGGIAVPGTKIPGTKKKTATKRSQLAPRFGNRTLRKGMNGDDVRVLKGIVRSKSLLRSRLTTSFDRPTKSAVKKFQKKTDIRSNGVVNRGTAKTMVRSLRRTEASWYGPGLYGNGVACGGKLRPGTIGVAHKTLPCGSKVLVGYHGRFLMAKVIDRGPYIRGRALDLTYRAAAALNFIDAGVANVRYAVVKRKRR